MPGLVCLAPVRAVPHVPHLAEEHEAGAPSPPSETASSTSPRFLHRQGPGGGRRAGDQPRQERRGGRRPYSLISLMIDTLAIIFRWPSSALKKQGQARWLWSSPPAPGRWGWRLEAMRWGWGWRRPGCCPQETGQGGCGAGPQLQAAVQGINLDRNAEVGGGLIR